jgi:hypothetical protein
MHIELTVKTDAYRYLWLKQVNGFNPAVHCARCLKGSYVPLLPFRADRQIPTGLHAASELDPQAAPFFYLCGVTARWAENLHIAFRHSPGSLIEFEDNHIRVRITDAERFDILPLPDAVSAGLTKPFWSCRNYQFGWHAFPVLAVK